MPLCYRLSIFLSAAFTMRSMLPPPLPSQPLFRRALVASLLIHAGLLLIPITPPAPKRPPPGVPLQASLAAPRQHAPLPRPIVKQPERQVLTASKGLHSIRKTSKPPPHLPTPAPQTWSRAEKDDMDKFLDGLAGSATKPTAPRSGQNLASNAMATARDIGRQQARSEETESRGQAGSRQAVERFSLEMYFDALVKKLNKSAAFVKNDPRSKGVKAAAVQIQLNADGSLKSFRILSAADQQSEIAFIKSVVERAVPFAAFPADLRQAGDALAILICIRPSYLGDGGSFGFSRSLFALSR